MNSLPRLARAALFGLALVGAAPLAAQARPATPSAAAPAADTARDARFARADRGRIGGAQNGIWIVVISDFQCPYCKRWHEETEPLIERDYVRTGKAQIAYINFPIASIHPNAFSTHEYAMCAAEQPGRRLSRSRPDCADVRTLRRYRAAAVAAHRVGRHSRRRPGHSCFSRGAAGQLNGTACQSSPEGLS